MKTWQEFKIFIKWTYSLFMIGLLIFFNCFSGAIIVKAINFMPDNIKGHEIQAGIAGLIAWLLTLLSAYIMFNNLTNQKEE